MTTPISEIADGLSEAQRAGMTGPVWRRYGGTVLCSITAATGKRLAKMGLLDGYGLTPLGLSVKEYLEKGDRT